MRHVCGAAPPAALGAAARRAVLLSDRRVFWAAVGREYQRMHDQAAGPPPRQPGADWNLLIAVSRGVARFLPRGAMDSGGGAEVEAALRRLTASAGRVTIDLRHVTAIDAAAARALARCVQHSARAGTVVSIVAPRPAVAARLRDAGVPGVRPALHVVPA